MIATLTALALMFAELSLLAFGGGVTILPDMKRQIVEVHQWMSAEQFSATYALAQAAPGPNMMVVSLVGWRVAGWPGVAVATIATFGPSSLVTGIACYYWQRFKDRPWRRLVQTGLIPVTAGMVASSAAVITQATATTVALAGITAFAALMTTMTRIHPLIVLAIGAVAGVAIGGL